jgi:hypothetical protein
VIPGAANIAAAVAVGTVGAAFGSVAFALVDVYYHRRDHPKAALRPRVDPPRDGLCAIYDQVRFWAALAAAMSAVLGVVLIAGGDARVSASAYSAMRSYGGPELWGAAFVTAAAVTWLCAWRYKHLLGWAVLLQALPFAGIAAMFTIAAVQYPDANITAAPIYACIMVMHACLADYCRREY